MRDARARGEALGATRGLLFSNCRLAKLTPREGAICCLGPDAPSERREVAVVLPCLEAAYPGSTYKLRCVADADSPVAPEREGLDCPRDFEHGELSMGEEPHCISTGSSEWGLERDLQARGHRPQRASPAWLLQRLLFELRALPFWGQVMRSRLFNHNHWLPRKGSSGAALVAEPRGLHRVT